MITVAGENLGIMNFLQEREWIAFEEEFVGLVRLLGAHMEDITRAVLMVISFFRLISCLTMEFARSSLRLRTRIRNLYGLMRLVKLHRRLSGYMLKGLWQCLPSN